MRPLPILMAAAAATLGSLPAHGQGLGAAAGFREAFTPDYLGRDMDLFVEFLQLEDWQQPIVQVLLEDYQNDFNAGLDGVRDRLSSIKDQLRGGEQQALAAIMQPLGSWDSEKLQLKLRFEDNLRSQLSETQLAEGWPRLERAMRRDKALPKGELGGESVDLFVVARQVGVPPESMAIAREALEAYEVTLDTALAAREHQMEQSQPVIKQAMVDRDNRVGLRELEKIVARRVEVRQAQEAGRDAVAAAMGAPWGETLQLETLRRAYPTVYRFSDLFDWFDQVRALEGISPDQVAKIDSLESEYRAALDDLTSRLLQKHRDEEPKSLTQAVRLAVEREAGRPSKPPESPYATLHAERDALNEKYRQLVSAVLGDELVAKLDGAPKFDAEEARRAEGVANRAAAASRAAKQAPFGGGGFSGEGDPDRNAGRRGGERPSTPPARAAD